MQQLTKTAGVASASSTREEQPEFPGLENTKFPLRAAVVSKRPRGRPRGPRGFCFSVPGSGALEAARSASRLLDRHARNQAIAALAFRRQNPRHVFGFAHAALGRNCVHCAFAALLAAGLRLKGGAL